MLIYLLNFLLVLGYGLLIKNKKKVCILATVQMFLILAFRAENLGVDLTNYQAHYEYWKELSFGTIIKSFRLVGSAAIPWGHESGYVLFNWVAANVGLSFHAYLVICAAICMCSIGRFIYRYSDNPVLSFIVFITLGGYELLFGILRQSLGLAIFLFAIPFLKEKKFWKYIGVVFIASLFHSTFLLTAPLYFFSGIKCKKKFFIEASLISVIAVCMVPAIFRLVIAPIFSRLQKEYVLVDFQWNNLFLLMIILAIFIWMFYKETAFHDNYILGWGFLFGVLLQSFSFYVSIFSRAVIGIFLPFLYILLANIIEHIRQKRLKMLVKGIMYVAMFFAYIYFLQGAYNVPYVSVFS